MEAQEHSKYDLILGALEGSTVLAKPKVSRDVIVEVLKEHTELIRSLRYIEDSLWNISSIR